MLVAHIAVVGITLKNAEERLVVRWRLYEDAKWKRNGFWLFLLPTEYAELYERAYIELRADEVYLQALLDDTFLDIPALS